MIINNLPALQVVIPLIAAPLCAILPSKKLAWGLVTLVSLALLTISLTLASKVFYGNPIYYAMGNWPAPFGIEYRVDSLSSFMLVIVSGVAFFTSIYAYKSVDNEVERSKQPLFYAAFLMCLSGLLGIVITNDAFNIYVFLEISSLSTYALVAMGKDRRALFASFEYLILGTIGATFILIAVGLLYMMSGTLNISDLALRLPGIAHTTPVKVALAFFTVGLALKMAIFPLHIWLANSYTNAPSFISAFLAATATKVSIYVLIRVLFSIFGYEFSLEKMPLDKILMTLSLFAIVVCSLVAIFQRNVKRMLAYSSVAQVGYMVLAIGLVSQLGMSSAVVHIFNHAIAKCVLFMAVGCLVLKTGAVRIENFKAIATKMPYTMAAFLIAGLSLIGVPGTGGFISKWYLLMALSEQELWFVFAVIILSSLLALAYIWRIVEVAYFETPEKNDGKIDEAPFLMLFPMWAMTLMTVIFGVYPAPVMAFAEKISKYLFGL